jgi:LysR family transcriptional regulator, transcriptional activator of nhaA
VVGISDLVPKLLAYRVLQPVLAMAEPVQIVCDEDTPDRLLADLAEHAVDVVLSDSPVPSGIAVKAYNHLLGTTSVTVFGAPRLAVRYRKEFPASLDGAPFLLPMEGTSLRRSLEQWFEQEGIRPKLVGEFKDAALMKTFGQAGAGLFVSHTAIEEEIRDLYRVAPIGRIDSIIERFYAISVERRLKHPAVLAISEAARERLFAKV